MVDDDKVSCGFLVYIIGVDGVWSMVTAEVRAMVVGLVVGGLGVLRG
jgi:hypothetical protein